MSKRMYENLTAKRITAGGGQGGKETCTERHVKTIHTVKKRTMTMIIHRTPLPTAMDELNDTRKP